MITIAFDFVNLFVNYFGRMGRGVKAPIPNRQILSANIKVWGMTMTVLKNLWRDDSGASAAEYALILAIVGTAIALAAITLGGTIATALSEASTCIATDGVTCN